MSGYDVILFDFDGTLCDTREAVLRCLAETVERHCGAAPARRAVEDLVARGLTLEDTLRALVADRGRSLSMGSAGRLVVAYRVLYGTLAPSHSILYPGVRPLLADICARCTGCAIVSNKGEQAILRTLEHLGIAAFDLVIAERPGLRPKPHPAAFADIVERRFPTVPRGAFLMVGDTAADLEFARNAGIASCWATYGYGDPKACVAAAPDHVISAFEDLRAILAPGWPPVLRAGNGQGDHAT